MRSELIVMLLHTDFHLRRVPWLKSGCSRTTSSVCDDQAQELMLSGQSVANIRQLGCWKGINSLIFPGRWGH